MAEDDDSFIRFVDTHSERLFHVARLLTSSPTSAEDLLQETLSALYPHWGRVDEAAYPLAYVRRALTNRFISSNRRQPDVVLSETLPQRASEVSEFDTVVDRDQLSRMLITLPARQRSAIVLRYLEDLSDDEIAQTLGCRTGTVRSLISRGLSQLRQHELPTTTTTTTTTTEIGSPGESR